MLLLRTEFQDPALYYSIVIFTVKIRTDGMCVLFTVKKRFNSMMCVSSIAKISQLVRKILRISDTWYACYEVCNGI